TEYTNTGRICQYSQDWYVRSKASLPDEATRRARRADAPANHPERGRTARGARPRAHLDRGDRRARRRAPLDGLPPLSERGGALRRLLVTLARRESATRPRRLGHDRGPRGANG